MKKIIPFLLAILFAANTFAQNTEQKISDKVTVTFPGKPMENKLPNGAIAYVFVKDSTASYLGLGIDLSSFGLTADAIAAAGDDLWEQMKGPMMAQLPGAVISKDSISNFKGKSSLYMEIDGSKSTAPQLKGKKSFGYAFFIGAVMHQVVYYSTSPTAKAEDAKAFFDSVVIKE